MWDGNKPAGIYKHFKQLLQTASGCQFLAHAQVVAPPAAKEQLKAERQLLQSPAEFILPLSPNLPSKSTDFFIVPLLNQSLSQEDKQTAGLQRSIWPAHGNWHLKEQLQEKMSYSPHDIIDITDIEQHKAVQRCRSLESNPQKQLSYVTDFMRSKNMFFDVFSYVSKLWKDLQSQKRTRRLSQLSWLLSLSSACHLPMKPRKTKVTGP